MLTYKYNLENAVDLTPLTEDKFLKRNGATPYEWVYDNELKRDVFHIYRTATEGAVFRTVGFKIPYDRFPQQNKNLAIVYRYKTSGTFGTGAGNGAWVTFEGRNLWEGVGINSSYYVKNLYVASSDNWNIGITKISKDNPEYTKYSNSYRCVSVSLGSSAINQDIYISDIMVLEITDEEYNDNNYKPTTFIPFTLPIEYQQVEYIESTGTQYIDTGVNNNGYKSETEILWTQIGTTRQIQGSLTVGFWGLTSGGNYEIFQTSNYYAKAGRWDKVIFQVTKDSSKSYRYLTVNDNILFNGQASSTLPGDRIYIFNVSSFTSEYYCKCRIKYQKIWDNSNNLVRHFIPCYRKNDGVIGMFDIVNNIFYTNSGTGTFNKGKNIYHKIKSIKSFKNNLLKNVKYIKTKVNNSMVKIYDELPSEYQRVEYIETTGSQFVNTGIYPNSNIQIETSIEVTTTSQDTSIFGCFQDTGVNSLGSWYHLTPYNSKWYFGGNGRESNGGTYNPVVGTKYDIVFNNSNGYISINNNVITTDVSFVGYSDSTLTISRRGQINNPRYGKYKYFKFKVFDKNTNKYIADYVPCYRKIDNVIGLYDLVNNVFYTNAGSDTFSKGSDI